MRRATTLALRRSLVIAVVASAIGVLCTEAACVIAQPTDDVPKLPASAPVIVRDQVVPSITQVLTTFPSSFYVPVELVDPTVDVQYASFIDYNPLTGNGFKNQQTSVFDSANPAERVRPFTVTIPAPSDLDRCHVIEVVVALTLNTVDGRTAHTPLAPGGDSVSWFYAPGGDLTGCPTLDAGIEASVLEDASESGTQ